MLDVAAENASLDLSEGPRTEYEARREALPGHKIEFKWALSRYVSNTCHVSKDLRFISTSSSTHTLSH